MEKLLNRLYRAGTRALEKRGEGVWIPSREPRPGVALFLFGETGERLAAVLPSREQIEQLAAAEGREPSYPVIFADRAATVDAARVRQHVVTDLASIRLLDEQEAIQFVLAAVASAGSVFRLQTALFTPEFGDAIRHHRELLRELHRQARVGGGEPTAPIPSYFADEVSIEFRGVYRMLQQAGRSEDLKSVLNLYYYGSPELFDYREHVADSPGAVCHCLGWRTGEQRPQESSAARRELYIWLGRPLSRVSVLAALAETDLLKRYRRVVAYTGTEYQVSAQFGVEWVASAGEFLRQAQAAGADVIADGEAPLLPLLSAGCRVILLEGAAESPTSLFKCSYFRGQNRWPVYRQLQPFVDDLASKGFEGIWQEFAGRQCSLERDGGVDFQGAFIRRFCLAGAAAPATA